jgi:hypothetical protein
LQGQLVGAKDLFERASEKLRGKESEHCELLETVIANLSEASMLLEGTL